LNGTPGHDDDLVLLGRVAAGPRGAGGRHHRAFEAVLFLGHETLDAPGQAHAPGDADQRRQREHRHAWPFAGHQRCGLAGLGETADRLDIHGLGDLAGRGNDGVGGGVSL
jgi:hypothetical protein